MATVTDKERFTANIIDKSRYEKLSDTNKELFVMCRNSLLEIFPTVDMKGESYDEFTLAYAENFAFIQIKVFGVLTTQIESLKNELEKKMQDMQTLIQQAAASATSTETVK